MILLLSSLIFATPKFTELKAGECAPWDGRLLNDEALAELNVTLVNVDAKLDELYAD